MRYAKLINNYPSYAPRRMKIGSAWVYNPTDAQLLAEGYLPVVETDPPEAPDGYYYSLGWEEQDGQIVRVWVLEEMPPEPDELTPDEALDIILGGAE